MQELLSPYFIGVPMIALMLLFSVVFGTETNSADALAGLIVVGEVVCVWCQSVKKPAKRKRREEHV